jgi:hypothetical protein
LFVVQNGFRDQESLSWLFEEEVSNVIGRLGRRVVVVISIIAIIITLSPSCTSGSPKSGSISHLSPSVPILNDETNA